jgi:hypothetical protein
MRLAKMFLSITLFVTVIVGSSFIQPAHSAIWFLLGEKKVGFGVDHDVIRFSNWRDDVRQIQLRVSDGPLKMYDMKIYFDNGGVQDVALRSNFRQGSESRVIDLDGGLRHLDRIEFTYETKGFARGRSRVAVWGHK